MNKQKQKGQLPVRITKIALVIAVLVGLGTISVLMIMKQHNSETNNGIAKPVVRETGDYYDVLEKKCAGDSCCLASLKTMRENNYKEADENGKCPKGFDGNMMRCPTSYQWCELSEKNCAKAGEFANPEQFKGKTKYFDSCCSGLKKLSAYMISDNGKCEAIIGNPFFTCMPCGNGVCETINDFEENRCNCPEDCKK